ncbi:hypothetical protein CRG98_032598 [Punica granatum]|uniref:Uncharacterized protein n=1 Tax=Punica granatum TaxID=22663 RepID=A0A2I0ITF6_PUNGR|nr:hypothetical protein CRG98_032598 [Punica granatum]
MRARNQSSLELLSAFILVERGLQLSQAEPPSHGLGTFGTIHERLGLSLRSPRSPTLYLAVVGVIVPTSFPPSCRCRCSRVSVAHHVQPGHSTISPLPRLFPSYIEASGKGLGSREGRPFAHGRAMGAHGLVPREGPVGSLGSPKV